MVRLSPRSFRVVAEHEQVKQLSSAPIDADHVGALLAETRQSFGFDLATVANALCIRTIYLQAIEEGRYADLPGVTYAIGFVRTYADYLGLDSDALVARFKSESAAWRSPSRPLTFPETRPERVFPGAAVIALSGVLIAVVFGAWVTWRDQPTEIALTVGAPPAITAVTEVTRPEPAQVADARPTGTIEIPIAPAGDPVVTATPDDASDPIAIVEAPPPVDAPEPVPLPVAEVAEPAPSVIVPPQPVVDAPVAAPVVAEAPPAADPLPSIVPSAAQLAAPAPLPVIPAIAALGTTSADLPDVAAPRAGSTAAIAAEPAPALPEAALPEVAALPAVPGADLATDGPGREYGRANRDARIVLRAVAESWVQVRDLQQNVVLTRMLQPGDSYRVPDRPDLTLLTGNAGGIEITVDGVAIPALGPAGAVRRDVPLTPDTLLGN